MLQSVYVDGELLVYACMFNLKCFIVLYYTCIYLFQQVMQPNLDGIQQALNKATQHVLEVSRGIAQWGQTRFRMPEQKDKEAQEKNKTPTKKVQRLHYQKKEDKQGIV